MEDGELVNFWPTFLLAAEPLQIRTNKDFVLVEGSLLQHNPATRNHPPFVRSVIPYEMKRGRRGGIKLNSDVKLPFELRIFGYFWNKRVAPQKRTFAAGDETVSSGIHLTFSFASKFKTDDQYKSAVQK